MATIKFKDEIEKVALDTFSKYDETKALCDLEKINTAIRDLCNNVIESIENAKNLDKTLIDKYKTIQAIHNIIHNMKQNNLLYIEKKNILTISDYIDTLIIDRYGIYASILIKHNIKNEIKDIIDEIK